MITWFNSRAQTVLIGLFLLALPLFYFNYSGVSWHPLRPHDHLIQNGLAYVFLLVFTYINHTYFVPRWFLAKRYRLYLVVAMSCVLGAAYLPYRIEQWAFFKPPRTQTPVAWFRQLFIEEMMLDKPAGHHSANRHNGFPHRPGDVPPGTLLLPVKLMLFFLLGSISTLLSLSVQTANRLRQVETDQLQAELRQLRAQIQPHFLFNTLNSIYALALRQDPRTADTVVQLSEFMRYTTYDAHADTVLLQNEINYIGNYIDLQKARLREAVTVDYRLTGEAHQLLIAPLLLFSLIENAFKYGVNPDEESLIRIYLTIRGASLHLEVVNNIVHVSPIESATGIGLQNARQRLRLLYPGAHTLTIDDTGTRFHVVLHLTLS